jgi:hypothetical protein
LCFIHRCFFSCLTDVAHLREQVFTLSELDQNSVDRDVFSQMQSVFDSIFDSIDAPPERIESREGVRVVHETGTISTSSALSHLGLLDDDIFNLRESRAKRTKTRKIEVEPLDDIEQIIEETRLLQQMGAQSARRRRFETEGTQTLVTNMQPKDAANQTSMFDFDPFYSESHHEGIQVGNGRVDRPYAEIRQEEMDRLMADREERKRIVKMERACQTVGRIAGKKAVHDPTHRPVEMISKFVSTEESLLDPLVRKNARDFLANVLAACKSEPCDDESPLEVHGVSVESRLAENVIKVYESYETMSVEEIRDALVSHFQQIAASTQQTMLQQMQKEESFRWKSTLHHVNTRLTRTRSELTDFQGKIAEMEKEKKGLAKKLEESKNTHTHLALYGCCIVLTQSLNHSITQSLNHSITQSLNHSITQSLNLSLSLFHFNSERPGC